MGDSRPIGSDLALRGAARTDPDAFGEFYRRHATAVERWIRAQTPDVVTAADLTAETFAQALVSLSRFRGTSDEAARGWLFGIARNLVRRYHRRGRVELATCRKLRIQLDHDPNELARIEAQLDAGAQAGELTDALDTLPDAQRQALQLRVIDELDYGGAAGLMGISEQNARMCPQSPLAATTRILSMTSHDPLPAHLDRIGRQLTAAAHQLATQPRRPRRRIRALGALPVAAAVAAAVVLLTSASPTTTPAYALTRHSDGSITITLNQLTTGSQR